MKRLLLLAAAPLVLLGAVSLNPQGVDAVADTTPDFTCNFEQYSLDQNGEQLKDQWTNGYFEKTGDLNEVAGSPDKFKVMADPKDATNKCLYIDTATSNESFFYLSMKDIFVKNFTLEYDYMPVFYGGSPWAGINCRKPMDGRYNGVTNVMMNARLWDANSIGPDFYRSVDDSLVSVTPTGYDGTGPAKSYTSESEGYAGVSNTWLKLKFEVVDSEFSMSINGIGIAKAVITKKSALQYGYVSLTSCINKGYVDNIHLTNLDEEPYTPPTTSSSEAGVSAPTMATTLYTINEGEDAVVSVDTYGEKITALKMGASEILTKYYTLSGTSLTISKDYLTTLGVGTYNFTLTTAGGTVGFKITIEATGGETTSSSEPATSSPETPIVSSGESASQGGGCGGAIGGTIGVSALAVAGIGFLAFKRKKKETK